MGQGNESSTAAQIQDWVEAGDDDKVSYEGEEG